MGRTDIADALKKLNSLIQNDVPMATAQTMKATFDLKDGARPRLATHSMLNHCRIDVKKANDNIDRITCS
jgi:hypothetical protein